MSVTLSRTCSATSQDRLGLADGDRRGRTLAITSQDRCLQLLIPPRRDFRCEFGGAGDVGSDQLAATSGQPQFWSQSSGKSRGPFTVTIVAASNVPADADSRSSSPSRTHLTRVGSLSGRAPRSYPAGLTSPRPEAAAADDAIPVAFFGAPAFASRVIPFPAGSCTFLTVGLPATRLDPDGVATFHMRKTRTEWGPLYPGDDGAHPAACRSPAGICRIPAATSLTSARSAFLLSGPST